MKRRPVPVRIVEVGKWKGFANEDEVEVLMMTDVQRKTYPIEGRSENRDSPFHSERESRPESLRWFQGPQDAPICATRN